MMKIKNKYISTPFLILFLAAASLMFCSSPTDARSNFGSIKGSLNDITDENGATKVFVMQDGRVLGMVLNEETLIWQDEKIIHLSEKHVGQKIEIEFYMNENGEYVCEWVELAESGMREMPHSGGGEKSKSEDESMTEAFDVESLLEDDPNPSQATEDMSRQKNKESATDRDNNMLVTDLVGSIDSEGRDLINMSPKEYDQSVEEEAQKILKELGIE